MATKEIAGLSIGELDDLDDKSDARTDVTDFETISEAFLSRRNFLGNSVAFGAAAFVMGAGVLTPRDARANGAWLNFEPVKANTLDTITVPKGFRWHTVMSWGDPMWSNGVAFDHATRGTGAS